MLAVAVVAAAGISPGDAGGAAAGLVVSLTLEGTVVRALERSTQTRVSRADVDAQRAKKRQAWAGIGPRVNADYTQLKFDKKLESTFGPIPPGARDADSGNHLSDSR